MNISGVLFSTATIAARRCLVVVLKTICGSAACMMICGGCVAAPLLYGGMASMGGAAPLAGDIWSSTKKETDVVLADGVTGETLRGMRKIAITVQGISSSGPLSMYAFGGDGESKGMYTDMIVKEFLKQGCQPKAISADITEENLDDKRAELVIDGIQMIVIGNFDVSTTTSTTSSLMGGNPYDTGVVGFSVKGINAETGDLLFIMSSEYGKAKKASIVAKDVGLMYKSLLKGPASTPPSPGTNETKPKI